MRSENSKETSPCLNSSKEKGSCLKLSKETIEALEEISFSDEDLSFLTFCRGLKYGNLENLVIREGKPFEVQRAIETKRFHKFS